MITKETRTARRTAFLALSKMDQAVHLRSSRDDGLSLRQISERTGLRTRVVSERLRAMGLWDPEWICGAGRPKHQVRGLCPKRIKAPPFTDAWWEQNQESFVAGMLLAYPELEDL